LLYNTVANAKQCTAVASLEPQSSVGAFLLQMNNSQYIVQQNATHYLFHTFLKLYLV